MSGLLTELKQTAVDRLLGAMDWFAIVIDPKASGVVLPEQLLTETKPVVLHIGRKMAIPIPDLQIDEKGISGTLSFSWQPFFCVLPWHALIQVSTGEEHMIWVSSGEPKAAQESAPASEKTETAETQAKRPTLRLV